MFDRKQKPGKGLFLDAAKKEEKSFLFKPVFPQGQRITSVEFEAVLKKGRTTQSPLFSLCRLTNNKLAIAVVASKKVSKKAVIRNKNKRRIRNLLKNTINNEGLGYYILFIKKDLSKTNFTEVKKDLNQLISKSVL